MLVGVSAAYFNDMLVRLGLHSGNTNLWAFVWSGRESVSFRRPNPRVTQPSIVDARLRIGCLEISRQMLVVYSRIGRLYLGIAS